MTQGSDNARRAARRPARRHGPGLRRAVGLYEDDGRTRAHENGAYARQQVNVSAPASGSGTVTVFVGAPTGHYAGKPASRGYEFTLHVASAPGTVTADGAALPRLNSRAAYDAAATGRFFDAADRAGVLRVKAGAKAGAFVIAATGTSVPPAEALPSSTPIPQAGWSLVSADSQEGAAEITRTGRPAPR